MTQRSIIARVHKEFMELAKKVAEDYDEPSITETTKHIAREYSEMYYKKKENGLRMSKKAYLPDLFLVVIFMFLFIVVILIAYKFITNYNTQIQSNDIISSQGKSIVSNFQSRFVGVFDFIWVFLIIMLSIAIGYGAYYLNLPPIFYFVGLFFVVFLLILTASLSNTFSNFEDNLDVARDSSNNPTFTVTGFILDHYVTFILFVAFIIFIIGFAKFRISAT